MRLKLLSALILLSSYCIASTLDVEPTGNLGVNIASTFAATDGGIKFNISQSTSNGVIVYNSDAQANNSANTMMTIVSTNTAYGGYFIRILRNDTNSNGEIRVDSPNPNFEFVETDQTNKKFEIGINNGTSYWATRNSSDNSFERIVEFKSIASGNPGIIVKSTGTVKLEDTAGSTIGFKAPNTLGASWTHDLWSTTDNTDKTLTQTASGGSRPLAFVDTFATTKTKAQLKSQTPSAAGKLYYCSDCVTDAVCVSTASLPGAVARLTSRDTPID